MRFCYFGIYDPEFSRNRIYMRALRNAGHDVIECRDSTRGPLKYIRLAWRLRLLKGSYDAIIVGYPGHIVVTLARFFGSGPVLADLLGSLSDAAQQSHGAGFFARRWLSLVDWLAVNFADVVLAESDAQSRYLETRFGAAGKYRTVYTGADEEVFGLRAERKTSASPFTVLFRGRLTPESGIMYILDAAESFKNDPGVRFRVIGYGRLLEAMRERMTQRGLHNVELVSGHLSFEEIRSRMLDADVSLGQFETNERLDRTIPHKAFESISMGIPYITARARAASEILEDEVSCLMVPPADQVALRKAIERLKEDHGLRDRLVQEARRVYESRASAKVIANAIADITAASLRTHKSSASARGTIGKREMFALAGLLLLFVAIRVPGFSLPYHQDEWKNAEMVRTEMVGGLSAHPPLMELIYRWSGEIVGADNLRLMPLVFGVVSVWLLYAVVRRRLGISAAISATGLYAISVYGALASLMLDMDGTILPTFFLASVYAYDRFLEIGNFRKSIPWLAALCVAILLGFLTKLSFVLVPAALALDYVWHMRKHFSLRMLAYGGMVLVACAAALVGALFLAHKLLPAFDISATISHALSYVRFEGRGYMQILIQGIKAVLYLSPLLILMPTFLTKEHIEKNRVFLIYGIVGFIFYFILFDFSEGALDKYLMYAIVPLCAIAGSILGGVFSGRSMKDLSFGFFLGAGGSVFMIALTGLPHQVMPLYPKTAWLSAVVSGDWNILFPFTGGNGPLGFYMSFAMMAGAFILCAIIAMAGKVFSAFRLSAVIALVVIGLAYNAVFMQELYWGTLYGSAPDVLEKSLNYIAGDEKITSVLTHADAGAYELKGMGKYAGRFYAVPDYEEEHQALFAKHNGHYLVVNVPLLNKNSFYSKFFATCKTMFATSSGVIDARVYDCAGSDPYVIK